MIKQKINEIDLIKNSNYGFRGTDKGFYELQLRHSERKFGKPGWYSADSMRNITSLDLDPIIASQYAIRANENLRTLEAERGREVFKEDYEISEKGPAVYIINLENYKTRILPGVENGFVRGHGGRMEYLIEGPIEIRDIRILGIDEISNLEKYLPQIGKYETESYQLRLKGVLMEIREMFGFL